MRASCEPTFGFLGAVLLLGREGVLVIGSSVMKFSRTLRICPTVMLQRLPATLRLQVQLFQKSANALLDLVSDRSYCLQRLTGGVG